MSPLQKLPKNVGDFGKLIVAKALKSGPKSNKSPNLVTLVVAQMVEVSLLSPEVHCLNPVMCNFLKIKSKNGPITASFSVYFQHLTINI